MGFFGKPRISESEAAATFAMNIMRDLKEAWPRVAQGMEAMLGEDAEVLQDPYARYNFALAVIAMQLQAVTNLLPENAPRIRANVLECLHNDDLGTYPEDSIAEYQNAWDECLRQKDLPMNGIASVLFDKLGCSSTVAIGNGRVKSPVTLMALTAAIMDCGSGQFWKTVSTKFKVTRG